MTDKTQYGLVRLADEDRKLLRDAIAAVTKGAAAAGKTPAKAKEETAEDDFGNDESGEESGEESGGESESAEDDFGGDAEEIPSLEDVRAKLTELANTTNKANAVSVMKKASGTDALSKVAEDKRKAVIDACDTAIKAAKAKAKKK